MRISKRINKKALRLAGKLSLLLAATSFIAACGSKGSSGGSASLASSAKSGAYTAKGEAVLSLSGFHVTFDEDFTGPLDVSAYGPGTRWIAHKPDYEDFGEAAFTNPSPGFPFSVENGVLTITMANDGSGWKSGLLSTVDVKGNGFAQQYGYFEMRAKLPPGEGTWPAFWLMARDHIADPANHPDVEIDVIEQYGKWPTKYHENFHVWTSDYQAEHLGNVSDVPDLTADYHRYGVMVAKDYITYYFDGNRVWQHPTPAIANQPLYMMVNLARDTQGDHGSNTPNPSKMLVDYVRAWAEDGAPVTYTPVSALPAFDLSKLNTPMTMMAINSGKYLRASSAASLIQDNQNSAADEQFTLQSSSAGRFSIQSVSSGNCISVVNPASGNGAAVQLAKCDGSAGQIFQLGLQGDGSYELKNASSQQCPGIYADSRDAGASVVQWDCNGTPNNHFYLKAVDGAQAPATQAPATQTPPAAQAPPSASQSPSIPVSSPVSGGNWVHCADEDQYCSFTGSATVRYGANGIYVTQSFTNGAGCANNIFGDPVVGYRKSCDYMLDASATSSTAGQTSTQTPNSSSGAWTKCADEDQHCSFSGTMTVRYGVNGIYVSKVVSGGVDCSNNVFGDPVYGYRKICEYQPVSQSAATDLGASRNWVHCADEDQTCTFTGPGTVRYGANGTYVNKRFSGSAGCSNNVFGDPLVGTRKTCDVLLDPPSSGGAAAIAF